MRINIFITIIFLLSTHLTFASIDIQSKFYTTNDGLGNNFVRHIYHDSKGFVWFSTLNGLSRYDGHSFINFTPERKDKISLAEHHVREVVEDKNHLLWIYISPEYLSCYDLKTESFVDYTGTGEQKNKFNRRYVTKSGDTWITETGAGCRKIIYDNGKFKSEIYNEKNGKLPSDNVRLIKDDSNKNYWICTSDGLVKVTGSKSEIVVRGYYFTNIEFYNNQVYLLTDDNKIFRLADKNKLQLIVNLKQKNNSIQTLNCFIFKTNWVILTPEKGYLFNFKSEEILPDNAFSISNAHFITNGKNYVYLYNDKGEIRIINNKSEKLKTLHIPLKDRSTDQWCKFIEDSRGWIWIATFGNGLYLYKPEYDEVVQFTYEIDKENYICSNSLTNIAEDRSGGIWISTESAGISHLKIFDDKVQYIYPENKLTVNNSNSVRMLHQLNNGVILMSNREGDIYSYNAELSKQIGKTHFESSIYTLFEDTTGTLWYGSRASGIKVGNEWITKGIDIYSLPSEKVSLFHTDYRKRIWLGTYNGGLALISKKDDKLCFNRLITDTEGIISIRSLTSDKNNWMWAGTDYGLCVFHPDSLIAHPNKFYQYSFNNDKLLANRVKFVFRDSKNRIWIGTMGGGLSQCIYSGDYSKIEFKHYTTNNGLTNNVVQSITEDNMGKLWIATEYGISRFSPESETFENFFFSKTIQGNIFNENSVLKLKDGRLLFGTYHGVAVVNPKQITSPQIISNITITNLKINGISMKPNEDDSPLKEAISYSTIVELNYNQNSFVVEFATFDYSSTNTSKYTYKLEPYDNEWSTPSTLNFAAYKKLKAGKYTLKVRAANSAGVWSDKEAVLKITVHPPFWATSLAYFIYFLSLVVVLYFTYRIVTNFYRLRKRIEIEHQLTDYKLMFFTNISHEFRTPLTLIKGVLEKMESAPNKTAEISESVKSMSKSTNRLLRLINQLLEFRKMQNNKLSLALEDTEVIAFFQEIYRYFEELASDKKIDYKFITSVPRLTMYLDKSKVDKMLFNLLSNAFKYTPNGGKIEFTVHVNEVNQQLILSVSDSGVGIPKEKQKDLFSRFMQTSFSNDSVGIGLHLTQELVTVHKGNITFTDKPEGGSEFTIFLPLESTVFNENDYANTSLIADEPNENLQHNSEVKYLEDNKQAEDGNKRKILLIEDDIDINKFLAAELSQYFDVTTAYDGTSGLEAAQTFDGDLIICDVLMPGMNGYEVTRNLKDNFETCHIPVILLTAMSSPENQMEGTKAGADAYITKPFSPKLLLARISQLIKQRELLRSKFSSEPETTTSLISVSEIDQRFVDKLNLIMENQLENQDFSIDEFALKLHLGRTSFFRKVKGITGYTPNEYMRIYRLKKAMEFLKEGRFNVSEVSFRVGINDPLYFSRCFRKQFGVAPSVFLRGSKEKTEE